MSFEVFSAEIENHKSHTFSFSQPIDQYLVGFSRFFIEYPSSDHHVKSILIDLSNIQQNNNEIIVTPNLRLNDSSNHTESIHSTITVVVLAAIGSKNPNIDMKSNLKTQVDHTLTLNNPTFSMSALTYASVQYNDDDHHLHEYSSQIECSVQSDKYTLNGRSLIQDSSKNSATGDVQGSYFLYNGTDKKVMCGEFHSKKVEDCDYVNFGKWSQDIDLEHYKLACFINGFDLSFKNGDDHHLKRMEVSCEFADEKLVKEDDSIFAKILLKATIADEKKNCFDIPHNAVTGYVVAFKDDSEK